MSYQLRAKSFLGRFIDICPYKLSYRAVTLRHLIFGRTSEQKYIVCSEFRKTQNSLET